MIFNITACGVKSNNTSKSPLRQTKDMAENVYDAIKNHDSEKLKEQFCERLQPGKETAVDKIYEYIDGENAKTRFRCRYCRRTCGYLLRRDG